MKQKVVCDNCKRIFYNKVKIEPIQLIGEDKTLYSIFTYKYQCPVCKCKTGTESFVKDEEVVEEKKPVKKKAKK